MKTDLVLQYYIYAVADLPPRPPVILESENEQLVLANQQLRYTAYSLFLRWIRLGEKPEFNLFESSLQHYEPFARYWDALLTMAIEVYPRTADEVIRSYESPAQLWFTCLLHQSKIARDAMLTGDYGEKSKRKRIVSGLELCRWLDDLGESYTEQIIPDCLTTRLILIARTIARNERDKSKKFDKRVYRPFIRKWRQVLNYAWKSDALQLGWIELNGRLFITSKGQKALNSSKN